jgi:hypothetical protein
MTRQEKEDYLVETCDKYGFREDSKEFRDGVSKFSDYILDLKIDSLNDLLEDMKDGEED